jgi:nucleoid DNA-binding protein
VNKSGLIHAVSTTTGTTKREAAHAVGAVVHAVTDELRSERRVSLVGFDTFNPTQRGARVGRHPQALKKSAKASTNNTVRPVTAATAAAIPVGEISRSISATAVDNLLRRGKQRSDRPTRPYGVLRPPGRPSMPRRGKQLSDRPRRP